MQILGVAIVDYKDWVNLTLQFLTLGIVLSGIIGFLTIRNKAKKQATKIAKQVSERIAKEVAERITNEYIQQNLLSILEAYKPFSANNSADFNVENLNEEIKNETK